MDAAAPGRRFDTLLLLGLPASGKSVIRQRLATIAAGPSAVGAAVGPTIQLDDFPYVHLMWRVDEALAELGQDGVFYVPGDERFRDVRDFTTLIHLLDEDHAALGGRTPGPVADAGPWVLERLSRARTLAGVGPLTDQLGRRTIRAVGQAIEEEAVSFARDWCARRRPRDGTVVIEFARGGPAGARPPLAQPFGYAHALECLSPAILRRAVVLYVWVTPAQSRDRNRRRATLGAQGSTLGHAVPGRVMREYYGVDDMDHLIATSGRPGTLEVPSQDAVFYLPVARVDNRAAPEGGAGADALSRHLDVVLLDALNELSERVGRASGRSRGSGRTRSDRSRRCRARRRTGARARNEGTSSSRPCGW